MAGTNGTVVSVSGSGSTTNAKVHFDSPPPGRDEVYLDVGSERAADFRAALGSTVPLYVDTTGTPPSCGTVTVHK